MFLLTSRDRFFDRSHVCRISAAILADEDKALKIDLPPPTILKPARLWTGKQIFSMILKPNRQSQIKIQLRGKGKNYSGKGEDLCVNDGWFVIHNSDLVCGTVDKSIVGSGSKNNVS